MAKEPKKVRRVVIKRGKIPTLSELAQAAYAHNMTIHEYVAHLNMINSNKSSRRNLSSSYDMGPEPWKRKGNT